MKESFNKAKKEHSIELYDTLKECMNELYMIHSQYGDKSNAIEHSPALKHAEKLVIKINEEPVNIGPTKIKESPIITELKSLSEDTLDNFIKKLEFKKSLERKYIFKFCSFTFNKRVSIVKSIHKKYSSKKYHDREYKAGREPNYDLYFLLYEYGRLYGSKIEEDSVFITSKYSILNKTFIIGLMYGQGTLPILKYV